jgi:transposase InsO family protein
LAARGCQCKHWRNSEERDTYLAIWTNYYNHQRPHGNLGYKPPISRSEPSWCGTTS